MKSINKQDKINIKHHKSNNMCLYPKLIKNRKYIPNKKNGGVIPPINDKRVLLVPVGCGKCMECKKQKARTWQTRLSEEIRHNNECTFVTLTFSPENIIELDRDIIGLDGYNLDNEIATLAVRRFLERWRKKYKKSIKHWLITEIGGTRYESLHLHGIIWSKDVEEIKKIWKYGYVFCGDYVNEITINYIIKYVHKTDEKHENYQPKILTSNGIGKQYLNRIDANLNKYVKNKTNESYKTRTGVKINLPIYYRNKIYTEEEKEKLWLEKLDKDERWICGEKIDISNGEEDYYKLLEYYRKKNKRLGYGNNEINWEKKIYENQRRNLKHQEKINNSSQPVGRPTIAKDMAERPPHPFLLIEHTIKDSMEVRGINPKDAF